ncbi:MAG: DUF2490 domain-containing protein [Ferruginibacter sp.]
MQIPIPGGSFYKLNSPELPDKLQTGRIIACLIVAMCIGFSTKAQNTKTTENINEIWFGYLNQTRLSHKWGLWADVHLRTKEKFVNNFSQSLIRLGLTYYLNDEMFITAGYTYSSFYPDNSHKKITQPEHRPWQQIQWQTNYRKKRMTQRFRLEERYRRKILNDSTLWDINNFNYRIRYNILYELPLGKNGIVPNSLSFVVNEEININFGREIVNNYFDQNRFYLGLKYQVDLHNNLQLGYMNLFQQLAAGNKYRNFHVVRLYYFQNLDLQRKSFRKKS